MRITRILTMAVVAVGVARAQEAALPSGHWEGTIKAPKQDVGITVDLAKNDKQAWIGSLDVNLPNAPKGIPIENVAVSGEDVSFDITIGAKSTFKGKLNAEAKTLAGTAKGPEGEVKFELKRTGEAKVQLPPPSTPITKDLEGNWEGTLQAKDQTYRLLAAFRTGPDGKGAGNLVSIDQGGIDIPITYVMQEGDKVTFEIKAIAGKYVGKLNETKIDIVGEWTQGPITLPLTLKKQKPAESK
jgi:hypothetical protein